MKGKFMKMNKEELRKEYQRSDFKKLERGKYYKRVTSRSNIVVLDPEVSEVFPNAEAVNEALHALVDVVQKASRHTKNRNKHRKTG